MRRSQLTILALTLAIGTSVPATAAAELPTSAPRTAVLGSRPLPRAPSPARPRRRRRRRSPPRWRVRRGSGETTTRCCSSPAPAATRRARSPASSRCFAPRTTRSAASRSRTRASGTSRSRPSTSSRPSGRWRRGRAGRERDRGQLGRPGRALGAQLVARPALAGRRRYRTGAEQPWRRHDPGDTLRRRPLRAGVAPTATRLWVLWALNGGDETPGRLAYSVISSATDLNVPSQYSPLKGGSDDNNTVIQAICPGRSVDHGHMVYDAVAVALVLDALRHDGPARASRIPKARCDSTYAGDIDPAEVERQLAAGVAYVGANYTSAGLTESEPALKDYATRAAPRPRATLRVHPRRLRAGTSATVSARATGTAHGQSWPLAGAQVEDRWAHRRHQRTRPRLGAAAGGPSRRSSSPSCCPGAGRCDAPASGRVSQRQANSAEPLVPM